MVARNFERDPGGRLDVANPKSQTHVAPSWLDFFLDDSPRKFNLVGCCGQNVVFLVLCEEHTM